MFKKLKDMIHNFLETRREHAKIDPYSFHKMAKELEDLTHQAEAFWPYEEEFVAKINRIREEMRQLQDLAKKPEFKRLSPEKRLKLRESLLHSREQLLSGMSNAPTPTDRLQ